MSLAFNIAAIIAIVCTIMAITRYNVMHALLYLVTSFMAVAVIFFTYGAPFIAALELIVYAGAIMVLMVFVIMMLNLGGESAAQEKQWLSPRVWAFPALLSLILLGELIWLIYSEDYLSKEQIKVVDTKEVALSLYGPYMLTVELSAMLLMAGIVGAYHLGRQRKNIQHRFLERSNRLETSSKLETNNRLERSNR